jgi:hypothetical protein
VYLRHIFVSTGENYTKISEILKVAFREYANGITQLSGFTKLKKGGSVDDLKFRDIKQHKTYEKVSQHQRYQNFTSRIPKICKCFYLKLIENIFVQRTNFVESICL